ncbi:MAG: DotH/IcmK family type IV secretion protein [Deltaproteobacteria bacterium]|nr:DotH/IcmK family type IV secretion protein [Deltaproteobacteria bacterium]
MTSFKQAKAQGPERLPTKKRNRLLAFILVGLFALCLWFGLQTGDRSGSQGGDLNLMDDLLTVGQAKGERRQNTSLWPQSLDDGPLAQNQTDDPALREKGFWDVGKSKAAFDGGELREPELGESDLGFFETFFPDPGNLSPGALSDFGPSPGAAGSDGPLIPGNEKTDQGQLAALSENPEVSNDPNDKKSGPPDPVSPADGPSLGNQESLGSLESLGSPDSQERLESHESQKTLENLAAKGEGQTSEPNSGSAKALALPGQDKNHGQTEPGDLGGEKVKSPSQTGTAGQGQGASNSLQNLAAQDLTSKDLNAKDSQVSQGPKDPLSEKLLENAQKEAGESYATNPEGQAKEPDASKDRPRDQASGNGHVETGQPSMESAKSLDEIRQSLALAAAQDEPAKALAANGESLNSLPDAAKTGGLPNDPLTREAKKSAVKPENPPNDKADPKGLNGSGEKALPNGSPKTDNPTGPGDGLDQSLVANKDAQKGDGAAASKKSENDQGALASEKADKTDPPKDDGIVKAPDQLANRVDGQKDASNKANGDNQIVASNQIDPSGQKDASNQTKGANQNGPAKDGNRESSAAAKDREPIKTDEMPGEAVGGSKGVAENDQGNRVAGAIKSESDTLATSFDPNFQTDPLNQGLSPDGESSLSGNDRSAKPSDGPLASGPKERPGKSREGPKDEALESLEGLEGLAGLEGLEDLEELNDPEDPEDFYELEAVNEERRLAYERSLEILLPTTPEEVRAYRKSLDEREEALSDGAPLAMRSRTERVRLEPGFKPPLVELSPNLVTALVFTDSTGSPWPVAATVLGSGAMFSVELLEGEGSNQIIVAPLSNHGHSNLVVSLKGKDIPLMARLSTTSAVKDDRELDGLIIFQVQETGPMAQPLPGLAPKPTVLVDNLLYELLDGITPKGAKHIGAVPALEGESFTQVGSNLYLRSSRTVLWPLVQAKVYGPGGIIVYELPLVTSVVLNDLEETQTVILEGVEIDRVVGQEFGP